MTKLSAVLLGGAALTAVSASAFAADLGSYKDEPVAEAPVREFTVSGSAGLTTDYIFRGMSQSDEGPALQAQVDIAYGMFYAGVFGSSIDFDGGDADLEIDVYAGVKPTWNGVTFDFGVIYYGYPDANDEGAELDYVELKAGVSGSLFNLVNAAATVYFSPEYTGETGESWTYEGSLSKTLFTYRDVAFDLGGTLGYNDVDEVGDYTYWNVGLTATYQGKYSIDVRYHDTDLSGCDDATVFQCDERVVGTAKIAF